MSVITVEVLRAAMPRCHDVATWAVALDEACEQFGIGSADEVAMLLAQIGHESADLTRLAENLNYSADRLVAVWPSRFPSAVAAAPYARNPEALANRVYGGRMGNGPEESGDGWMYRGRGPVQLTGRLNYSGLGRDTGWPVVAYPDLVSDDPRIGAASACWYWARNVRMGSIQSVTRQINGGLHGLEDRTRRYERAQAAMQDIKVA